MKPVYDSQTRKLKEDLARQLHDAGFGKREAFSDGGRVKFQEGTNLMNVLDNMAMENMNRKLGIEFRGEIPKGVKFRTDLGTAGDPMAEARGDLTEQDIQTDDVLESEIFKIMLEKSKRDQEKLFYTKRNIEKMGGTRFIEDFPDQAEYLKAVGKDIASPRGLGYVGTKLLEGVVGGLEFIPGQAYTLAKGDLEFYQPVLPEKFGITSLAEKVKPDIRTSGLMAAGDIAKFTGEFVDPFIVYGLTKKGISAFRKTPDGVSKSDEILSEIDPTRRDVLKTGAVMTGGAMAYPLAKKISLLEEAGKGVKAARILPKVKGMPEWFSPLVTRIEREGIDVISQAKEAQKLEYKRIGPLSNTEGFEIIQSKRIEIPVAGKKEPDIITMTEYKNGDVLIESNTYGGAFDSPFELYYSAPKEVIDTKYIRDKDGVLYDTPVKVKKEGKFMVIEDRPYNAAKYPFDKSIELDRAEMSLDEAISDVERLEGIATEKKIPKAKIEQRTKTREFVEQNPYDDVVDRFGDAGDYYDN